MTVPDPSIPSGHAVTQYATTSSKLAARLAIHNYNTHTEDWFVWASSRIPKTGSILEVGAGTGALWSHLPPKALSSITPLTLTDFSPAMCDALRTTPISGLPNVSVQQCDATSLPFASETYDTVIANHMLYHVDDPDSALAEFQRVLKPGGLLVIALNGLDHLDELLDIGARVGRPSTIRNQARITAETAAEQIGRRFEVLNEERFPGAFRVPEAKPVLDYLDSLGEEDLDAEKKEVARRFVESRIQRDGAFEVTKNMVLFTARKA
ncbi:methyltransferase type 11 [Podospora australis]|uniref:Methyltransferase type 11 n=1 Tax=Podospora australis TaxID=1536484 RepID=A0AAN6WT46_9PEZI|nr:methyltransferase type 11 [Podospora australis]